MSICDVDNETTRFDWKTPKEAVEDFEKGLIVLAPPTWVTLVELVEFPTIDKLKAAGIMLEWRIDENAATAAYSAEAVLQIYRILQEACTNAMRHSGGSHLLIALEASDCEDYPCVIVIEDNGAGFIDDAKSGRGLNNMRARAARIGGRLLLCGQEGVRIELRFSPPASEES